METKTIVTANWFSNRPRASALFWTLFLGVLLYGGCYLYLTDAPGISEYMAASKRLVFTEHEWWRAWTTLIAHGDLAHLLANSFLFFLFSYSLMSYFSLWFFPLMGFLMGGVTNLVVLLTLGNDVHLVGASGLVHWMGAAWATLYFLLENRQSLRQRFGSGLFLMLVLFTPDTYRPNVSYLAHFVGFIFGILSAGCYYLAYRTKFLNAIKTETLIIPEWEFGPWDIPSEEAQSHSETNEFCQNQ